MVGIAHFMAIDHCRCDDAFALAEAAGAADGIGAAEAAFEIFYAAITRHIAAEEELLFPAFEAATGRSPLGGPTEIMRIEHEQLREVLEQMRGALASAEASRYRALYERLFTLMLQHNIKEERMMYPMLDRALGEQADALIAGCRARGLEDA